MPTTISGLIGVKQITAGYFHTIALMNDSTVKAWGFNLYGQLGISTNSGTGNPNPAPTTISGLIGVKQITAGYHTVALMNDGTVKAWGSNQYGQLGVNTNSGTSNPNPIPTIIPGLTGVNQIAAGGLHTVALMNDGTVRAWGNNYNGQLGNSTNSGTSNPNPVPTTVNMN